MPWRPLGFETFWYVTGLSSLADSTTRRKRIDWARRFACAKACSKVVSRIFCQTSQPKTSKVPQKSRNFHRPFFYQRSTYIQVIRYSAFLHLWPLQAHSSQTMDSKHSRVAETRSVATGSPDANSSRSSRDEVENVVKAAATCVGREKNKILFGRNRANQLIW